MKKMNLPLLDAPYV